MGLTRCSPPWPALGWGADPMLSLPDLCLGMISPLTCAQAQVRGRAYPSTGQGGRAYPSSPHLFKLVGDRWVVHQQKFVGVWWVAHQHKFVGVWWVLLSQHSLPQHSIPQATDKIYIYLSIQLLYSYCPLCLIYYYYIRLHVCCMIDSS